MVVLAFKSAHPGGLSDVAYVDLPGNPVQLVTCGKDGKLCYRSTVDPTDVSKTIDAHTEGDGPSSLTAVAAAPLGDRVAVADEQNFVKLFSYPAGDLLNVATRFTLPPRALAFSPSGTTLAAGGDDEGIKLVDTASNTVFRSLQAQPYTRGLAYDPEGKYLASAHADGTLVVWDIGSGKAEATKKRACSKLDPASAARLTPAWHPDGGSLLAAPAPDGAIALFERLSWAAAGEMTGQHGGGVQLLAFSKNGLYLASAAADQSLVVWDMTTQAALEKTVLPGAATGLAWHPSANELSVITEDGEVAVWQGPVPSSMPGPAADVDALAGVKRGDALVDGEAADAGDGSGSEGGGSDDEYDREDSFLAESPGGGGGGGAQRGKRRSRAGRGLPPRRRAAGDYFPPGASALDLMPAPQPPMQPGSTRLDAGRRYLSYTALGAITLRAEADHNVVEVSFHDTARARRRVPLLNDFFGFTLGALGERGALYASRAAPDAPSTLVYRPYEAWAENSDWSAGLPAGEEAECLAAGASFCAVATSARHLRLFSQGGVQTGVLALAGAPLALAARGHSLAAAWHAAAPTPGGDQCVHVAVHDVAGQRLLHQGPLPLSPGATLAWLGFSEQGQLGAYDSAGVLRLRSPDFGGAWVPVFSAAAERKGAENFWLFSVSGVEAQCIVCANRAEPAVPSGAARPVVSAVPLAIPVVKHDDALAPLESDLLRQGLALAHAADAAAGGTGEDDDEESLAAAVSAAQVQSDRAAVRLFTKLVQGDRWARALEVAEQLRTPAALAGAMKIANHQRATALADELAAMIERRMEAEAAAAAPEPALALVEQAGYYGAGRAAPASPSPPVRAAAAVGGGLREHVSPGAAAEGEKPAVNAFARMGGGSKAENGSPGVEKAAAAPAKRKALVGNPFARKKPASSKA